jgi:hypothetical protein
MDLAQKVAAAARSRLNRRDPMQGAADGRIVDQSELLVRQGRPVDAVDLLAAADRRSRDERIEIRLRDLRRDAAHAIRPAPGKPSWPPPARDPYPGLVGVPPEVQATHLTSELLAGCITHHGCVVVRRLFSENQVSETVEGLRRTQARQRQWTGDGDAWYSPIPTDGRIDALRQRSAERGGTWLADSPAMTARVLDQMEASGALGVAAAYLGERPFFSLQKSTLRCVSPVPSLTGWHQDGSFLDEGVRTVNVWVALSACGGQRPASGLEIVARRLHDILPADSSVYRSYLSPEVVAEAAEGAFVRPEFDAGDALMFDERLLHRTDLPAGLTDSRYALECWLFAPSHAATGYISLLV